MTDQSRAASRAQFINTHGYWDERWESLIEIDPVLFDRYAAMAAVPWRKGHLEPKVRALVLLAIDVASTHLHPAGIRQHVGQALDLGASREEILEVVQLVSGLGIHAMNVGVPMLVELLEELGLRQGPAPLSEHQEALKAAFIRQRGYWHDFWAEMLELDPEMFEAFTEYSSIPWRDGPLEPKIKEFIYIAFDSAATHLYLEGWRLHMRNALQYGATAEEIIEVMELSSTLGIHGPLAAAPIVREEFARRGM